MALTLHIRNIFAVSSMSRLHRVFVYGTLKRGQPNHYLLQEAREAAARLLGEARLAQRYPLILTRYGIPMLLAREGVGEVGWNLSTSQFESTPPPPPPPRRWKESSMKWTMSRWLNWTNLKTTQPSTPAHPHTVTSSLPHHPHTAPPLPLPRKPIILEP